MVNVEEIADKERRLGFERVELLHGSTYRDNSTVIVVPTVSGLIHKRVVAAWENLIAPMNTRRAKFYTSGHEVGIAYDEMIKNILAHPLLSTFKYVLTAEDDNIPAPDAHIRLLETIHDFKFDAVSGIYFTKGAVNMPMAYGDPKEYARTGQMDFRPRDPVKAREMGGNVMEVNGIGMGFALWRMDLFRQFEPPWYVTVNDYLPEKAGVACMTQDLYFCERLRKASKRLAVDLRVQVGHIDRDTGEVY